MNENTILSGVKPTGNLHLGNYLGAVKNWIKLQEDYKCFFFLADLHAITVFQDPESFRQCQLEMAAILIASGIDYKKHVFFSQSGVHAHAEIGWLFGCIARMGWMNRMTQFKEKAGKNKEKVSLGLYSYPSLQAGDIMLYKPYGVPVGEDQKQHIELCRDIVNKFSNDYNSDFFQLPEPIIQKESARIMSLRDGSKKMSKSDPSDMSRINLLDDADSIANKIRKSKSDPLPLPATVEDLAERPEAKNLYNIYASISEKPLAEVVGMFEGKMFSDLKPEITDLLVDHLSPISKKTKELLNDKSQIMDILKLGNEKASIVANENLAEVKKIMGFLF